MDFIDLVAYCFYGEPVGYCIPSYPPYLLLLLIHCGLLAGEGAAGRGALGGELIAIGIMSAEDKVG